MLLDFHINVFSNINKTKLKKKKKKILEKGSNGIDPHQKLNIIKPQIAFYKNFIFISNFFQQV